MVELLYYAAPVLLVHSLALEFRLALEQRACPTRCVFVVSDLFSVDPRRFQRRGSCAGHHHGDEGTDPATEAQGQDAQADLEGPAALLLVACVAVAPPFSEE